MHMCADDVQCPWAHLQTTARFTGATATTTTATTNDGDDDDGCNRCDRRPGRRGSCTWVGRAAIQAAHFSDGA